MQSTRYQAAAVIPRRFPNDSCSIRPAIGSNCDARELRRYVRNVLRKRFRRDFPIDDLEGLQAAIRLVLINDRAFGVIPKRKIEHPPLVHLYALHSAGVIGAK